MAIALFLVPEERRFEIVPVGEGILRIRLRTGFMESTDVPAMLARCPVEGLSFDTMTTSYFLGRERMVVAEAPGLARWRQELFGSMVRNAAGVTPHFHLPSNRVIELGMQLEI